MWISFWQGQEESTLLSRVSNVSFLATGGFCVAAGSINGTMFTWQTGDRTSSSDHLRGFYLSYCKPGPPVPQLTAEFSEFSDSAIVRLRRLRFASSSLSSLPCHTVRTPVPVESLFQEIQRGPLKLGPNPSVLSAPSQGRLSHKSQSNPPLSYCHAQSILIFMRVLWSIIVSRATLRRSSMASYPASPVARIIRSGGWQIPKLSGVRIWCLGSGITCAYSFALLRNHFYLYLAFIS